MIRVGRQWLQVDNPVGDSRTNCVHITHSDGTEWTIHPQSLEFMSSVSFKKISLQKLAKLVVRRGEANFLVFVYNPNRAG